MPDTPPTTAASKPTYFDTVRNMTNDPELLAAVDKAEAAMANPTRTVIACPMCGWSKYNTSHGPTYKPLRWFRKHPFWRCTWCKYEWEDEDGS